MLVGCAPLPFRSQPAARRPVVGVLALALSTDPGTVALREAFRQGLGGHGWIVDQNITLEFVNAEGRAADLPDLARRVVELRPDVIEAAGGLPAARALKGATDTIPIVFATVGDPVGQGLIASLARPGGNLTGLSSISPELAGKRLELLREVVPGLSRVTTVVNPANPDNTLELRQTQLAAQPLGINVQPLEMGSPDDFAGVADALVRSPGTAVIALTDPLIRSASPRIAEAATQAQLPTMFTNRDGLEAGGFLFYGPDLADLFRRAAGYVDRILRGARPADLPVEQPTTFVFVVNLKAARALGLTVPQSVLQQATEVMQ